MRPPPGAGASRPGPTDDSMFDPLDFAPRNDVWWVQRLVSDMHFRGASVDLRHDDIPRGDSAWFADDFQVEPLEDGFAASWPSAYGQARGLAIVNAGARLRVKKVELAPSDPLLPVVDRCLLLLWLHVQHSDGRFSTPTPDLPMRLSHPHSKASSFRARAGFDMWLLGRVGELQAHDPPEQVVRAVIDAAAVFEGARN